MTTLSPADKAEMIRKYFPALLPRFNPDSGNIEAPSMTDPHTVHTITKHMSQDGVTELRCDCKSTRQCTHLILAEQVHPTGPLAQTVHIAFDDDFDARWSRVLRAAS